MRASQLAALVGTCAVVGLTAIITGHSAGASAPSAMAVLASRVVSTTQTVTSTPAPETVRERVTITSVILLPTTVEVTATVQRTVPVTTAVTAGDTGALPACESEDGSTGPVPCKWDATKQGNGRGQSFVINADGSITYQ